MVSAALRALLAEPTLIVAVGFEMDELAARFGLDASCRVGAAELARQSFEALEVMLIDVPDALTGGTEVQAALTHVCCTPRLRRRRVVLSCPSVLSAGACRCNADAVIVAPHVTRAFLVPPAILCHDYTTDTLRILDDDEDDADKARSSAEVHVVEGCPEIRLMTGVLPVSDA